mmetsp:Transcript_141650/g.353185  ORF Transcript_141650/g.353185 Transcript_141650/m.353185 type:complete len:283 (+) Transcript_141650:93-941(+)
MCRTAIASAATPAAAGIGGVPGGEVAASARTGRPCLPSVKPRAVRKIVYFVRHGQALHNILEEEVKAKASSEAEELGFSRGSPGHEAFVRAARVKALSDEALLDASLSNLGKAQLAETRSSIRGLTTAERLPQPTTILVSPLLRTLQSASILFPDHPNIRVCEMLRERRTGLPCDEHSPLNGESEDFAHVDFEDDMSPQSSICSDDSVEDAASLRERTTALSEVLRCLQDDTVCVVSHKGFLRELERGPFGREEAKEFKPGEVRVFDVTLSPEGGMCAQRRC